jgi:hypothetical protein
MQHFRVTVDITVNTNEAVSPTEVKNYVEEFFGSYDGNGIKYFDIGCVDNIEVNET